MGQPDSFARQWLLLKTLASRPDGITLKDLAAELGVHSKTVRRGITTLQQAGFALEEKVGPRGRKTWHLQTAEGLSQVTFPFDEALALYLGRRFLTPLTGTPIGEAASRAFAKVRACLGKTAVKYLDEMSGKWHLTALGAGDYSSKGEILEQLMVGLEDRKATHIEYQSLRATEPVTYEVHPYALVWHRGSLYLVAFSRDHDETRTFKVDRIEAADASTFPFVMAEDFDLATFMSRAFGVFVGDGDVKVTIHFRSAVARYVEESTWHASQKLTKQRDGSVLAEFRLSDTREIKRWILGFGSLAEVLEPEELRHAMAEELWSAHAYYVDQLPDSDRSFSNAQRNEN